MAMAIAMIVKRRVLDPTSAKF